MAEAVGLATKEIKPTIRERVGAVLNTLKSNRAVQTDFVMAGATVAAPWVVAPEAPVTTKVLSSVMFGAVLYLQLSYPPSTRR